MLKQKEPLNFNDQMLMLELYYLSDQATRAIELVEKMKTQYSTDYRFWNSLGRFYLDILKRPEIARYYFEKSLDINNEQTAILYVLSYLDSYCR